MDSVLDSDALLEHLGREGPLLAAAVGQAGWEAPVPGTDWSVRDLVRHIGTVHQWATAIVGTAAATPPVAAEPAEAEAPDDDELADWYLAAHAELMQALAAAPADLACFTFLPAPSPRAFWIRRQAHETAVHRADAAHAAGAPTDFEVPFAQDGIAEIVDGFGARRAYTVERSATVLLRPDDAGAARLIRFGGERTTSQPVEPDHPADAVVSGSSSALYLWLWHRPADVKVTGDATAAALWGSVRIRFG